MVVGAQLIAGLGVTRELTERREAARAALAWVIAESGGTVDAEDVRARFDKWALKWTQASQYATSIASFGDTGPFEEIETLEENGSELVVVARGPHIAWRITVAVTGERIRSLSFEPHPAPYRPALSWAELDAALRAAAPEVGFLAAEVVAGRCRAHHAVAPDETLALASGFKLYVLGAVGEAVASGRVAWAQRVTIRPAQLVQGSFRYGDAAGQRPTVRELARAMINASDNTATDVLIELVGREAVEAAFVTMGMTDPSRNVPLLLVREFSALKWGRPPLAAEYAGLTNVPARRSFLKERIGGLSGRDAALDYIITAKYTDGIEWFATPTDQCRALLHLQEMAKRPGLGTIRKVLELDNGSGKNTYIAYKPGREPGVVSHSLYLERSGKRYVVVILLRNRHTEVALPPGLVRDAQRLLYGSR